MVYSADAVSAMYQNWILYTVFFMCVFYSHFTPPSIEV